MQKPAEVIFRNVESDSDLEADVRDRIAKLEQFCDSLIGCHVVIEGPPQHQRKGGLYHVRIRMTLPPRREISVDREPAERREHEDVRVAVRDAFDAARRQLQDAVRQIDGRVKAHAPANAGRSVSVDTKSEDSLVTLPDAIED